MSQAILATLLAGTTHSKRYAGFLFIALAPVVEVAYRFLDPQAGNPEDYWNAYYYLYAAGPHIAGLLTATGFFLLVHEKWRNWAIIPGAYKFAKIIWLSLVSTNEQLHQFVPWGFLFAGLGVSVLWFISFDYLVSLHFHKREGKLASAQGALDCPGFDDKTARTIASDLIKQARAI